MLTIKYCERTFCCSNTPTLLALFDLHTVTELGPWCLLLYIWPPQSVLLSLNTKHWTLWLGLHTQKRTERSHERKISQILFWQILVLPAPNYRAAATAWVCTARQGEVTKFSPTGGLCPTITATVTVTSTITGPSLACWQRKNKVDTTISYSVSQAKIPTNRGLFVVKLSTKQTTWEEKKAWCITGITENDTNTLLLYWGITVEEKRKRLFIMLSSSTPVIWLIVCTG